ncbi:hypothetical protein CRE_01056 [Caenorhabditis remanei]|uniref:C2H2-type domain-containing protein n=1 Tax=Caenorhabditis remanei TaxID=31234 RepID=E3MI89_CAERE|nr:hypothetical protein CRE_01056 [Caenorhabditis remanei]
MELSNQRKRQLVDATTTENLKKALTVKPEPIDDFEKGDHVSPSATPILSSIISTPPSPPINRYDFLAAFRQFLNGYLQAGGDVNLVNALANYATALPLPPNPLKPLSTVALTTFPPFVSEESQDPKPIPNVPAIKLEPTEQAAEPVTVPSSSASKLPTLSAALGEEGSVPNRSSSSTDIPNKSDIKPPHISFPPFPMLPMLPAPQPVVEATSEIQRLREAAFGRYKNVLCVICNEWICSRNRKNHIEAHLNYRPYKCSACTYARRREIFVTQHIKSQHKAEENVTMLTSVDLHVSMEVDRLADECVTRTRKLIENMQEKKDGDFGENKDFDEKALELMMSEEAEKKVVLIESVSAVRPKVANYHRRQRTKVLKKIYDTDVAKQAELKIVKEEEGGMTTSISLQEGFEIKLEDLMKMVEAVGGNPGSGEIVPDDASTNVVGTSEPSIDSALQQ